MDTALAVVTKVPAGMGILKPKVAILLNAVPVGIHGVGIAEVLELDFIPDECDGSAAVFLDDLKGLFGTGHVSRVAPGT